MKPEELLAHADFVRSLARSLVLDEHRASDLVQETWLAALQHPPRAKRSARSWLQRVVRNFAVSSHRSESRRVKREKAVARPEGTPSADDVIEREEVRRKVVEAVLDLEEPYGSAILLRYYENLSPDEVAERLGVPVETIRTRLKRGLAKLRARLDKVHGGDRKSWCLVLAPLAGISASFQPTIATAAALGTGAAAGSAGAATGAGAVSLLQTPFVGALAMIGKAKALIASVVLVGAAAALLVMSLENPGGSQGTDETSASSTIIQASAKKDPSVVAESAGPPGAAALESARAREKLLPVDGEPLSVKGRILNGKMEPLEGATIRIGTRNWTHPSSLNNTRKSSVKWEKEGIESAVDGTFVVTVRQSRLPFTFLDVSKEDQSLPRPIALAGATQQRGNQLLLGDIVLSEGFFIRGRVIDEQGRPVPQCRVGGGTLPHESGFHLNVMTTDDESAFLLPRRDGRAVYVTAYLEDYGWSLSEKRIAPGTGSDLPEVTVVLKRCEAISGQVFDGDGSAAEGLEIHAFAPIRGEDYHMYLQATTSEEGDFRFFPAPEGNYTILAKVPGSYTGLDGVRMWTDFLLADEVQPGAEGLSLHLSPLASLVLELVDESGTPVTMAGSLTFTQREDDPDYDPEAPDWSHRWESREPTTDRGNGLFEYARVKKGLYDLRIWHRNYLSTTVEKVEIPAGMAEVRVQVELQTMQLIRGKVYQPDGSPARGVKVLCERTAPYSDAGSSHATFTAYGLRRRSARMEGEILATNGEGAFEFRLNIYFHYPRNIYHLYAIVDDCEIPMSPPIELSREHPQEELEFTLPDLDRVTGRIEGSIVNANGQPLANALVVAWDGEEFFCRVRADDQGAYVIAGLHDGRYIVDGRALSTSALREYRFSERKSLRKGAATLDKLSPFNAVVREGNAVSLDVTVDDPWNGALHGQVTCGSRRLPVELKVSLVCLNEEGRRKQQGTEFERPTAGDIFSWRWDRSCHQDVDPRPEWFRFQDLKAGAYGVSVAMSGRDHLGNYIINRILGVVDVVLETSENRQVLLDVGLGSIRGEVRSAVSNEPIADVWIGLIRDSDFWHKYDSNTQGIKTDHEGVFFDDLVPAGEYYFWINNDRFATLKIPGFELLPGGNLEGVVLHLEPAYTLRGRVVVLNQADDRSFRGYIRVAPTGWGGKDSHVKVADDGSFNATHLPAGPAKLSIHCRGKETITRIVELPQQPEEELVIEIE